MKKEVQVYRTKELAEMLFACDKTIRKWATIGILPPPIAPGRWLIRDIDEWLTRKKKEVWERKGNL
jgi:predicted DNA-binding transcriptional regulator AlpA